MATRVAKHWEYNKSLNITEFNKDELSKDNLVNQILVIKEPDISSSLVMDLFGTFNGKSLCHHYDTFEVPVGAFSFVDSKGKLVSNTTPFITTFGIWIFNIFMIQGLGLSFIFGGYINDNINKKKFGNINQKVIYALIEDKITVDTYKKFITYVDFIMPWETFLSYTSSEKMLACSKEIGKLKAKLIKENKEALDAGDATVAEDIENQLIEFVKEYLKDDPALDSYLSGAGGTLGNNFKNMYIMKGAIRNPDPNAKQEFNIATSCFIDGFSSNEYSLLANSLSGGPYSRAKKTELGGYWEKLVETAYSSVLIDEPGSDCGSDKYIETVLTNDLVTMFMYSYIIKPDGSLEELTSENVDKYINKKIKVRSTLFCKSKTGVCNCCAGNFFYRRGSRNIGLVCSQIPTKLKLQSMKSFHNSTISTTEIDPIKAFGI